MFDENDGKYADKSLNELKEILRERRLKIAGKKKDLIARLQFDDANQPTRAEPGPEFNMDLPDPTSYKDLHHGHHHGFPAINLRRLEEFLSSCDKKYDKKIQQLYLQRYIRYIRSVDRAASVYIKAAVWAEMKKNTSYQVDLCLNSDGVVQQTQCECAVGQGPSAHCKHVTCVLYALTAFSATGEVLTEVTCTQVLQKFHRAKPHKGSPLKSSQLAEIRGKSRPYLYDPRPLNRRNPQKNEEKMRNIVLNTQVNRNYCKRKKGQGKSRPITQKYAPANIPALYLDHDYMEMTMEDQFLKQLQVSHISTADIQQIEEQTRKQASCSKWREERTKRITSSHFGTVCKLTSRRDIVTLCHYLTCTNLISSRPLAHGRKYENIAVHNFETMSGTKTHECGLFVSRERPMLAATPDRIIDEETIVEVKCPYSARDEVVSPQSVPYLSLVDGKLKLKENHDYYYQIQGQLYCTCRTHCKFIVYTFKGIEVMDVYYNKSFVDNMLAKLDTFYNDHFKHAIIHKLLYKNVSKYNFS